MPQIMKCGGVRKHFVLKDEDVAQCPGFIKEGLLMACMSVKLIREKAGKDPSPEYLVINTDEPYAGEIIEILRRNGHWGPSEPMNVEITPANGEYQVTVIMPRGNGRTAAKAMMDEFMRDCEKKPEQGATNESR